MFQASRIVESFGAAFRRIPKPAGSVVETPVAGSAKAPASTAPPVSAVTQYTFDIALEIKEEDSKVMSDV